MSEMEQQFKMIVVGCPTVEISHPDHGIMAYAYDEAKAKIITDALNFARFKDEIVDLISLHIKLDSGADILAFANLLERIKEG